MQKIGIIDHKYGNFSSVLNAIDFLKIDFGIITKPSDLKEYSHCILPGVGSYKKLMDKLNDIEIIEPLLSYITKGNFFLGICVGMQILTEIGEEFIKTEGLKIIKGKTCLIDNNMLLPHVGWNSVNIEKKSFLFSGIHNNSDFYFTHSYHVNCDAKYISGSFNYGGYYAAAIEKDNIYGVQFHPEKSQGNGLKLLKNFCNLK